MNLLLQHSLSKSLILRLFILSALFVNVTCYQTEVLDIDDKFVSAGAYHTCGLENRPGVEVGGGIKCWGDNRKGQTSSPPGIYHQISCGKYYSCAISAEDELSCWGEMEGSVPAGRFKQVSVGQNHACALKRNGNILCWGKNDFGEADPPNHQFTQVSVYTYNNNSF
jgi:alpha-tubulin suppressor-like RCC1 family protein